MTKILIEERKKLIAMINGKQRSFLKALANSLDPTVFLGRAGLTDNIIKEIDVSLECRELVKVKLQEGCELKPIEVANRAAERLNAEFVQAIGRKFILYRESKENKQIELPKK